MICRTLEEVLGSEKGRLIAPMMMKYCTGVLKWKDLVPYLTKFGIFVSIRPAMKKFEDPYVTSRFWRGAAFAFSPFHRKCEHCSTCARCFDREPSTECKFEVNLEKVAASWKLDVADLIAYREALTESDWKYYNQPFVVAVQSELCREVLNENMSYIRHAVTRGSMNRNGKPNGGIRFIAQYQNLDVEDLVHDVAAYCWMMLCTQDWQTNKTLLVRICRNAAKQHIQDLREYYSTQSRARIRERAEGGYESTVQSLDAIECGDVITPRTMAPYGEVDDQDFVKRLMSESTPLEKKFISVVLGVGDEFKEVDERLRVTCGQGADEVPLSKLVSMVCEMWKIDVNVMQGLASKIHSLVN